MHLPLPSARFDIIINSIRNGHALCWPANVQKAERILDDGEKIATRREFIRNNE